MSNDCGSNGKGCYNWQANECAKSGMKCENGKCICAEKCVIGARTCAAGEKSYKECLDNKTTGCPEWVPKNCPDGLAIGTKDCQCAAKCKDQCASGQRKCSTGSTEFKECRTNNKTGCFEWAYGFCSSGTVTTSDCKCAAKCANQCGASGQRTCVANSATFKECRDSNNDKCVEWASDSCPAGTVTTSSCKCEKKAPQCTNDSGCLYEGYKTCDHTTGKDAYRVCKKVNGCLKWSTPASCPAGQYCIGNGQCSSLSITGSDCKNRLGERQCVVAPGMAYPTILQTCGEIVNGRLVWKNTDCNAYVKAGGGAVGAGGYCIKDRCAVLPTTAAEVADLCDRKDENGAVIRGKLCPGDLRCYYESRQQACGIYNVYCLGSEAKPQYKCFGNNLKLLTPTANGLDCDYSIILDTCSDDEICDAAGVKCAKKDSWVKSMVNSVTTGIKNFVDWLF
jgi:hypothetical protein